jgi:AcrR family transcriptional regulator
MVDAAFALFLAQGFDNVTMEEVAGAAGVSRSTAYRRFATKEDLVLEVPRRWLEAFDEGESTLDDSAGLADAIRATCMAVAHHIDANTQLVRDAYKVLEQASSLRASGGATTAWLERFVALIDHYGDRQAAEAGRPSEATIALAGAYLGAIDALMQRWADDGGKDSVPDLINRLLDRMEPTLA